MNRRNDEFGRQKTTYQAREKININGFYKGTAYLNQETIV
jgi:hypothetical protein